MARWGVVVRQMLVRKTGKVAAASSARHRHLRVSETLRKKDEDAYIPHFVSLGPNHFRKPDTDSLCDDLIMMNNSTNEGYKVKSAATLWQKLVNIQAANRSLSLDDDMVHEIEVMRPHIESFYDWSNMTDDEYRDDLALMMAVDSFFILQFLFGPDRRAYGIQIKSDILKLENQIPLSVLKLVFGKVKIALLHPDLYRDIWYDACRVNRLVVEKSYNELCPFDVKPDDMQIDGAVEREPHLLACIHAIVSRFLHIDQHHEYRAQVDESSRDDQLIHCIPKPTLSQRISNFLQLRVVEKMCRMLFFSSYKPGDFPIKGYTAEELAKAGIKFKSFTKHSKYIWFDKYSHILYLPRMTVTYPDQTEVFFKNLLALEFNDGSRGNQVRHFVQLMDALIDSSGDVHMLRRSHVIRLGSALSDDALTKIWDSMYKPFSSGHLEPPEDLKQALDQVLTTKCCIIKCRIALIDNLPSIVSFVLQKLGMWPW